MASHRQLKSKLRTVENIKQITKAMEMVSATKMRKSQEVALRARPFAKKALELLYAVSAYQEEDKEQNMFFQHKEGKACVVVVTSDKGLCASYNSQVLRLALQWCQENPGADIVAVGRKGRDFFKRRGVTPVSEFLQFSDIVTLYDVAPLSEWILQAFEQERYSEIMIASTHFLSALNQKPGIHQILPLELDELEEMIKHIVPKTGKYSEWPAFAEALAGKKEEALPYLLEPTAEAIFETLVRDLLQVEILHFILEANASEHSSRMVAMKNATENALAIEEKLQLALNKARQASITQELTEISTAKEALTAE